MMYYQLPLFFCDKTEWMEKSNGRKDDGSMNKKHHEEYAPDAIRCKIITVSDTRTPETDKSGKKIMELLQEHHHIISSYEIVKDDQNEIKRAVLNGALQEEVEVMITNGGTGITKRDVTIETIQPLLEKEIVGFGELFRMLSYTEDIGSAAMLSRALAGVLNNTVIFSLPGSTGAVQLGMNKLILPEIRHVVGEIKRQH